MKKVLGILLIGILVVLSTAGVKAIDAIRASSITYNDTTVEAALDELMIVASQCPNAALCSKVKLGDYISMTPTTTSYTIVGELTGYKNTTTGEYIDQTINPSELNLWRVISINSDGTIDMVSENVSREDIYFYGQEGYMNLVGALNLMAGQYGNSKYTLRTRHIGYNGQTQFITDTSKFTTTAPWTQTTNSDNNESLGGGDVMRNIDVSLVDTVLGTTWANKSGTTTPNNYWVAGRMYYYAGVDNYSWIGAHVYANVGGYSDNVLYYYDGTWHSKLSSRSIRPIVTLKPNVTTSTGNGTSASPWVLS